MLESNFVSGGGNCTRKVCAHQALGICLGLHAGGLPRLSAEEAEGYRPNTVPVKDSPALGVKGKVIKMPRMYMPPNLLRVKICCAKLRRKDLRGCQSNCRFKSGNQLRAGLLRPSKSAKRWPESDFELGRRKKIRTMASDMEVESA